MQDYKTAFTAITPGTTVFSPTTGTGWKMQLRAIASHPSIVQFYKTYTETNTYSIQVRQRTSIDLVYHKTKVWRRDPLNLWDYNSKFSLLHF